MRVTKVIREYVEREVCAKFEAKISEVDREYCSEKAELKRRLEELCACTELKALEIARSLGFDYRTERWGNRQAVSISEYSFFNEEKEARISAETRELIEKRGQAIDNILLSLELGETTKAELKSAIDAVKVES